MVSWQGAKPGLSGAIPAVQRYQVLLDGIMSAESRPIDEPDQWAAGPGEWDLDGLVSTDRVTIA